MRIYIILLSLFFCLLLTKVVPTLLEAPPGLEYGMRHGKRKKGVAMAKEMEGELARDTEIELKKVRKARGAHRAHVTKTLTIVRGMVESPMVSDRKELLKYKGVLSEKKNVLQELDREILEMMSHECSEDECVQEVEETEAISMDIAGIILEIEEKLEVVASPQHATLERSLFSENSGNKKAKAKLPKIELQTFDGRPHDWPEFWDAFSSTVDGDDDLPDAVKFQYLKNSLLEPAKSVISGFRVTAANYKAAVDLLHQRYAKPALIKRAHINEILKCNSVWDEKYVGKLRALHDKVETHHRGLEALHVEEESYATIVVPVLLEKIPQAVRLNMVRASSKDQLEWNVQDFLESLRKEIDVREIRAPILGSGTGDRRPNYLRRSVERPFAEGTATALHTFRIERMEKRCAYCLEKHEEENCGKVKDLEDRRNIIKKFGRCFICLKKGHKAIDCRSRVLCKICNGRHHISLCVKSKVLPVSQGHRSEAAPSSPKAPEITEGSTNVASCSNYQGRMSSAALQTAQAIVNGNDKVRVRVLFDSGSQKTFVTPKVVREAGLRTVRKESLGIRAFGSTETDRKVRDVVELDLKATNGGKRVKIEAFVVDKISDVANCYVELVKVQYDHLRNINFADISDEDLLQVDVLIGANYLWEFQGQQTIRGKRNEPVAVKTELGWVLSGPLKGESLLHEYDTVNFAVAETDLECRVEKFWDLDTVGVREDKDVYSDLIDNISYDGQRYSVGLPWKIGHKQLPHNFNGCFSRLKSQIKKLQSSPSLLDECSKIIKEQEEVGIIEKVTDLEGAEKVYYMPSQVVVRQNVETTKVRIVFDASSKEGKRGTSLNDCLHVGPNLTPLLFDILLRFRENNIALVGDIEKAFLNVGIHESDRNCLRFLWVENAHEKELKLVVYRFKRVVFGVNASPFLLNAVIRFHLSKLQDEDKEMADKMTKSFFVDDMCTGASSVSDAIALYEKSKSVMREGGFNLRKWKSNNADVRKYISSREDSESNLSEENTYAKETLNMNTAENSQDKTKVLGLVWNVITDTFDLSPGSIGSIRGENDIVTKRSVLSALAKLFDPLGLLSPVSMKAKSLFQELCIDKVGWDEELPPEKREKWERWEKDLRDTKEISVSRGLHPWINDVLEFSLHGFGDAGAKAYCAVIYLVSKTKDGISSMMVCAKTRIAPLKALSIPRLELMSARILVNLMSNVVNALGAQLEISSCRYWLDSQTALFWLNNAGEWKQFVKQRVNDILEKSEKNSWGYCPGKENPADIGSRGSEAGRLVNNELWWEGPKWLKKEKEFWPTGLHFEKNEEVDLERKREVAVLSGMQEKMYLVGSVIDIDKFSNMNKLLRVTSWVLRFVQNAKVKEKERNYARISVVEMQRAERMWVLDAQSTVSEKKDSCLLRNLGAFVDDGILRCKGRLENSDLSIDAKLPILIPQGHKFASLITLQCHERVKHLKVRPTLAEIRTKFWIPKGRLLVKRLIRKCHTCLRLEGKPYSQPITAALPSFRVKQADPFSRIGIDFAGPLYVKEKDGNMSKVYVALFTCCITRAVSLDIMHDLATVSFLRCFRRFTARWGTPKLVVSDNAKTFKATAQFLNKLNQSDEFSALLQNERIVWRFNLERSPWWGGFFERMVGTVKRCLRKVIMKAKLNEDELRTILLEIENTVNSRPLTYVYEELDSEPLTPSHLIFGRRLQSLPDDIIMLNDEDSSYSRRYRYLQNKINHFWKRWQKEYIVNLREHHKCSGKEKGKVSIGDIVLVQDDNLKRTLWRLGKIEELISGKDGTVRGAKVSVMSRNKLDYLSRPVQKLHPLERANEERRDGKEVEGNIEKGGELEDMGKAIRPRRAAARDAAWRTRIMLDSSESRRGDVWNSVNPACTAAPNKLRHASNILPHPCV